MPTVGSCGYYVRGDPHARGNHGPESRAPAARSRAPMTRTSIDTTPPARPRACADVPGLGSGSGAIEVPWGPDGTLELRWPADGPMAGAAVEVVRPDLSGASADYPAALRAALDAPVERAPAGGPARTGPVGGDRGGRPIAVDAGPRGLADRAGAAARRRGPGRGRDDQRRGRPAPCRGRRGHAPAGRRDRRGRLSMLQPAGG